MNLIEIFRDLIAQVPDLVQPLIVALAGAVPFIEGEGAATIGIIGGIHPAIAIVAAAIGNFVCVALLVLFSSGARQAIVTRRNESRNRALVGAGEMDGAAATAVAEHPRPARKEKFLRALEKYGVPGVSLLGPLLLPTQFTATMLAAVGVGKARILFWQAIAIVGWTTVIALIVGGAVNAIQ